jgi:hypothetical protein
MAEVAWDPLALNAFVFYDTEYFPKFRSTSLISFVALECWTSAVAAAQD